MIKLAVDAMGGDLGSSIVVQAVLNYLKTNNDVEFHVVGKLEELKLLEGKAIYMMPKMLWVWKMGL